MIANGINFNQLKIVVNEFWNFNISLKLLAKFSKQGGVVDAAYF